MSVKTDKRTKMERASASTKVELRDDAKENLVKLIKMEMRDFIRKQWEKSVADAMDDDDYYRNEILDLVDSMTWMKSKTRAEHNLEKLRLFFLLKVDLDLFVDLDDKDGEHVEVEGCVSPFLAVGVDDKLTLAQAKFSRCGTPLSLLTSATSSPSALNDGERDDEHDEDENDEDDEYEDDDDDEEEL